MQSMNQTPNIRNIGIYFEILIYHKFSESVNCISFQLLASFLAHHVALLRNNISCFSALEYCLDVEKLNLSAIRTVRVLRPLRAINRIPSKNLFLNWVKYRSLKNVNVYCAFSMYGFHIWCLTFQTLDFFFHSQNVI